MRRVVLGLLAASTAVVATGCVGLTGAVDASALDGGGVAGGRVAGGGSTGGGASGAGGSAGGGSGGGGATGGGGGTVSQECENGTAQCDSNATCTDLVGGHRCSCVSGYSGDGATCTKVGDASPAELAAKLGLPARLLVGTGGGAEAKDLLTQGLKVDIYERYLPGLGSTDGWVNYNTPAGAYVNVVARAAASVGAVPMYTLYMMASLSDGDISGVNTVDFMTEYWHDATILFEQLRTYDKPTLVQFEPDFWGYAQLAQSDPTKLPVQVQICADCSDLPNDVTGFGRCLVRLARKRAPKALVGFSPSPWGGESQAAVVTFMSKVGVADGDFTVIQTLDRDSGCFESGTNANCNRKGSGWYWDESNTTSPNFREHLAEAKAYYVGLKKPLVWWQTPMGAPSTTPGGTTNHYRDNREHYFLTHPAELVAAGGLGVVFGRGEKSCTGLTTDNGQFQSLSKAYFGSPEPL